MTKDRAVWLLSQMFLPQFDREEREALGLAIDALNFQTGYWIEHKRAEEVYGLADGESWGTLISNYECSRCHHWNRYDSEYCPDCGSLNKEVKQEKT